MKLVAEVSEKSRDCINIYDLDRGGALVAYVLPYHHRNPDDDVRDNIIACINNPANLSEDERDNAKRAAQILSKVFGK